LHHWEHLEWLHHRLVWQLLGIWQQGATEGSAYGPGHPWGRAPFHPGPLFLPSIQAATVPYPSGWLMTSFLVIHTDLSQLTHTPAHQLCTGTLCIQPSYRYSLFIYYSFYYYVL
jgi:hypothetical protein